MAAAGPGRDPATGRDLRLQSIKMTDYPVILALRTERSSRRRPDRLRGVCGRPGAIYSTHKTASSWSAELPPCHLAGTPAGEYGDDEQVTTRPVRDFDFHPDEDAVRVFTSRPGGVLRLSGDVYVSAARYGDIVLWHYAFARHWFKINLTTDLAGQIVETGDERTGRFAFNCDIATPMRRRGGAVFAVDLFADVLVRADGVTYQVCDLGELDQAHRSGLILPAEARGARSGLAELTGIIEQGTCWRSCPGPAALAHWARRLPPLPAARLSLRFRCSV